MKRAVFIGIIMLSLCLSGCNTSSEYTFMKPASEIVSMDIICTDPYRDYSAYNDIEPAYKIASEQWSSFISDFTKITCKRYYADPCLSLSGMVIRITYMDGSYEVISPYTGLHVTSDGDWRYIMCYFDDAAFNSLISAYTEDKG